MVNTNLISSYRRELMAVAMFAILLTHMNCDFGCFAINRLALCGQGGVDAFFFLSGFGMYYSGMKKTTLAAFYKKRAVRIFPSFLAIFGIYMYIKHSFSWQRLFWGGSTLAYWFPATRKYMLVGLYRPLCCSMLCFHFTLNGLSNNDGCQHFVA